MLRILFVCHGNICRSPTAEGVLRRMLEDAGLADRVEVDSAGTSAYEPGHPPTADAVAAARVRGYDLSRLRCRQLLAADLERFEWLLAMDRENLAALRSLPGGASHPGVGLLLDRAGGPRGREVPDPWAQGAEAYADALDLIEEGCRGLLAELLDGRGEDPGTGRWPPEG